MDTTLGPWLLWGFFSTLATQAAVATALPSLTDHSRPATAPRGHNSGSAASTMNVKHVTPTDVTQHVTPTDVTQHVTPTDDTQHVTPTDDTQHVTPTDVTQHVTPTDDTQHVTPTDDTQHVTPTDVTQHVTPTDDTQHVTPTDDTQHVTPTDVTQHVTPTDDTQHVTPTDVTQHVTTTDDDTQHVIPTDDTQHVTPTDVTQHITPTDDDTQHVTPTDVTQYVNTTDDVTQHVTPTDDDTQHVTPTDDDTQRYPTPRAKLGEHGQTTWTERSARAVNRSGGTGQGSRAALYDVASCVQGPGSGQFTINGHNGHIFFRAANHSRAQPCEILLRVPRDRIVRFDIRRCDHMAVHVREQDRASGKTRTVVERKCTLDGTTPPLDSVTDTLVIQLTVLFPSYWRPYVRPLLFLHFSAVRASERHGLKVLFLSSTTGYVQTPGWNGSTEYPPCVRSCVTLTPPAGHVVLLSVFKLELSSEDPLRIFPGECRWEGRQDTPCEPFSTRVSVLQSFLYPDMCGSGHRKHNNRSVSFDFSSDDEYHYSGFRVRFSFHRAELKPRQVGEYHWPGQRRWNCSVAVWPTLTDHFPCDFVSQCAHSEDEAGCPYSSEKCGPGMVDAGGRCYLFREAVLSDWMTADKICRAHGAELASLETWQEVTDVVNVLELIPPHYIQYLVWVGLTATQTGTGYVSQHAMYANTWYWKSDSVAYYLDMTHKGYYLDMPHCGMLDKDWLFYPELPSKLAAKSCDGRSTFSSKKSYLCEMPSASGHQHLPQPVTLPTANSATLSRPQLVTCPLQHVIHDTLACNPESLCWQLQRTAGEWYTARCDMGPAVPQSYFDCGSTGEEVVSYSQVCDFSQDCSNREDEAFCEYPACGANTFSCGQGQCLDLGKECDGHKDCLTEVDEASCPTQRMVSMAVIPPAVVQFSVPGGFSVTPLPQNSVQCPDTHFQCHDDGYCLPVYVRCNDVHDCPGHEDEAGCHGYTCPGFYRCRGSERTVCVHLEHLCDGFSQCPRYDDELLCDLTCPESCTCYGLAFTCVHTFLVRSFPHMRYLEARGSGLRQTDVSDNIMLIHLGVQACSWRNLTDFLSINLHSLDLSHNCLRQASFGHFVKLFFLRRLSLAGNPLQASLVAVETKYRLPSLLLFNFSGVLVDSLNMETISAMTPYLQVLDLSESGMMFLKGNNLFRNLRVLDLRGCPLSDFTSDFMKSMIHLTHVYADNFKLCCAVVLPDTFKGDCLVPSDEISSCDDLLKSSVYRFALLVSALLAIFGNLSSFVYRACFTPGRIKKSFAIFVLHLCVSDFLMGSYLVFIGVADRVFAGAYVWSETAWKTSAACSVAGFLSLLSSEVSAFLICLITLDRFLVLRFPFSQVRFGFTSAHVACVLLWALGLLVAAVPLLPLASHWDFYRQTGICIPLPVTRGDFAGRTYSFSVMIVCNLVLFVLVAAGQSLIFWSVRSNAMSEPGAGPGSEVLRGVQSREAVIATRLLSIAVSDFLCWFPIGLCGLLSAAGVTIPGEVNVAMAIFVMPLNSAINPFLYTVNTMMEKRAKAQERRFVSIVQAHLKQRSHLAPA